MAANYDAPLQDDERIFRELEEIIFSTFEKLIECVVQRRAQLLEELSDLRTEHAFKIASTLESIGEPEISKIAELEKTIPLPSYKFECDITALSHKVQQLGEFVGEEVWPELETYTSVGEDSCPPYELPPLPGSKPPPLPPRSVEQKRQPKRCKSLPAHNSGDEQSSFNITVPPIEADFQIKKPMCQYSYFGERGYGNGRISNPKAICHDKFSNFIFITSYDQPKICVFTSQGKFKTEFGSKHLQGPVGICVHISNCYVTDEKLNTIFKFTTKDYKLEEKREFAKGSGENQFGLFRGIAVDKSNEIYAVDNENHRVCVLNTRLETKRMFGQKYLHYPNDICISQLVYVLDMNYPNCVHGVTREGEEILTIVNQDDIETPRFFCITPNENVIINGIYEQHLKVFSQQGVSLTSIELTDALNPRGICVLDDSGIVCAYAEGKLVNCIIHK